ncbi:phosphomannomutase/phosphoglucomutase [Marinicella meishanensis]|uniref:phosphomannomutase/phosphoglucomutase n=1 Tax=Marinicella meishanensis TaxID=2873263 RepID=UPI001CBEACB7|nr:phosphomannomutase/phosphoglucomutase [Marinicella sp. NBU2979]
MDLNKLVASFKQKKNPSAKADKSTSEDEAQQEDSKKKKKPLIDFGDEYLWTSCYALAVIASLLFGYLLKDNIFERRALSHLESQSERLATQIEQATNNIRDRAGAIIAHNPDADDIVGLIEANTEDTLRVVKITEPVDQIEPTTEFPGINFATLDMIKQTSETQQEPQPEIHLYGQRNQYLNFVYIQKPNDTYVVVSYPVELIIKPQRLEFDRSELALVQKSGAYSSVVLQKWGQVDPNAARNNQEIPIPNSPFYVTYAVEKNYSGLFNLSFTGSAIALLCSLALAYLTYLKRKEALVIINQKKAAAKEEKVYVHTPSVKKSSGTAQLDDKNTESGGDAAAALEDMPLPDKSIFKAYDIRGIVDKTLTVSAVEQIGHAIGSENLNRGRKSIVVARDGRLSGPALLEALIKGIARSGCDVINIGAVPTGVLYFSTHHLETGSGVMLTGSHNPADYNGLKIMLDGETLAGKLISNLYDMIANKDLLHGQGSVQELDIADDYVDYISSEIQLENEPTVVVDCGNGIPGELGPEVLEEIGCEVIPLHCEVDGSFPNHHPDPSVPENLQDLIATLKSVDADIGIAFDGDGDRLGVVTKAGEIINPDRLLMLFAKDVLSRQPGSSIIFDVKCTGHLPKSIVKHGGMPIMWKTGHSFMKAKLKETNAALAGEMSGHFFFNERWFGFDDGIYAAARLLEILDQEDGTPEEVFDTLPNSVNTPELKVHMQEGEHYLFMDKFIEKASFPDAKITTIDGIRADFAGGWGLVRCSNTTPCLVIRFDADDEDTLHQIQEEFRSQLLAVSDSLELPF